MLDAWRHRSSIGDFHYNGHLLLTRYPACAQALDSYSDQSGQRRHGPAPRRAVRDDLRVARDNARPVRIGVNGGSLNQELVVARMQENTDRDLGLTSEQIINECMVLSALQSTELALESGLRTDQDHHLVQDVAALRPDCRLPRARAQDRSAAAPRADGSRHGDERPGLVGVGDGRAPQRGSATRFA